MAIGNAATAGLLAARIVAAYEPHIMEKMIAYQVRDRDCMSCPLDHRCNDFSVAKENSSFPPV